MESLGDLGESPLEESDPLTTATDEEQLSLADIPMVYKAHAAVGAAIIIEGFIQPLPFPSIQPLPLDIISSDPRGEISTSGTFSSL